MRITESQLRRIIRQERARLIREGEFDITSDEMGEEGDTPWKVVTVFSITGKKLKSYANKTVTEVADALTLDGMPLRPGDVEVGAGYKGATVLDDSGEARLIVVGGNADGAVRAGVASMISAL
jgi:hypothetical protein